MPRWKDDEDRGAFGAWLSAQVGDRTFDWLAAEMAERGYRHGADYYRAMASGNKPAGRVIGRALREYFGAAPIPAARAAGDDLAAALIALTEELRAMRQERESLDVRLTAVETAVALLAQPGGAGSREPALPRVGAG